MEATAVAIQTRRHGDIAVMTYYQTPIHPLETWSQTVAIGDFNAKSLELNSTTTNTRGRPLLTFLQNHDNVTAYGIEKPTFYRHIGRLDIALLRAQT